MGKACPFSLCHVQNLLKSTTFKMMVLHDTLAYEFGIGSLPALSSGVFLLIFGAKLYYSAQA